MKVIDILNKIANGEEIPIRLLAFGKHYEWKQPVKDYMNEDGDYLIEELISADLNSLCEEIPLIEEDNKIEKLDTYVDRMPIQCDDIEEVKEAVNKCLFILETKINEIIDYLNKEN